MGTGMQVFTGLTFALSVSSQLRPEGFPTGVGEVVLMLWLVVAVIRMGRRARIPADYTIHLFSRFWVWTVSCLVVGLACRAALLTDWNLVDVAHDGVAILLCLVCTIVLAHMLDSTDGGLADEICTIVAVLSLFSGVVYAMGMLRGGSLPIPGFGEVSVWYLGEEGGRYAGLGLNPNQLGFLLAGCPTVLLYGFVQTSGLWRRAFIALALVSALVAGFATESDGLRLGWYLQAALLTGFGVFKAVRTGRNVWMAVAAVVIALSAAVYVGPNRALNLADTYSNSVYEEGDQGATRLMLWSAGLETLAKSPVFGLGPGTIIDEPIGGGVTEAHNNFIDWAVACGLVGLAAYLTLAMAILLKGLRTGSLLAVSLLGGVLASSLFALEYRHPAFWMYLIFAAKLGANEEWRQRLSFGLNRGVPFATGYTVRETIEV